MGRVTLPLLLAIVTAIGPAQAEPYKVFRAKGNVNVKDKNGNWRVIPGPSGSDLVDQGETVKTGHIGCVFLTLENAEVEVKVGFGPDSEAELEEPGAGEVRVPKFNLKQGSAYCSVLTKAKKQGVTFKIETDVGVTGVTGTEFITCRDAAGMRTAVGDSKVTLSDLEGRTVPVQTSESGRIVPWNQARFVGKASADEEAAVAALMEQIKTLAVKGTTTVGAMVQARPELSEAILKFLRETAKKGDGSTGGKTAEVDGATLKKELEGLLKSSLGRGALWVVPAADFDADLMTTMQSFRNEFGQ